MITIKVTEKQKEPQMCSPVLMLSNEWPEGQVFQQYFNGNPQKDYYINCGMNELSVIHIWFSLHTQSYALSTCNKKSLLELNPTVLVTPIEAEILITLETT